MLIVSRQSKRAQRERGLKNEGANDTLSTSKERDLAPGVLQIFTKGIKEIMAAR